MAYSKKAFLHPVQPVFAASGAITPMFMPTDGVITRTTLSFLFNMTIPTSGSPAFNTLGLWKSMFTNLSITAAGQQYLQISDPLVALTNQRMRGIPVVQDAAVVTTTGTAVTFNVDVVFHWGSNPDDPYDLTGGILAPDYSQGGLVLNLTWPANSVAGTNALVINTATAFRLTNHMVVMGDDDYAALKSSGHFAQPSFTEVDYALTNYGTNTSGYQNQVNLPVGQFLREVAVLVENSSGNPTDANLNQMGLFSGGGTNNQVQTGNWIDFAQRSHHQSGLDRLEANSPTLGGSNPGMAMWNFQRIIDPRSPGVGGGIFGANLTHIPLGQYFGGFSVGTATGTLKLGTMQMNPTATPA